MNAFTQSRNWTACSLLWFVGSLVWPAGVQAIDWSKPDFVAVMDASQTIPRVENDASGVALFKFNQNKKRLRYRLRLENLDLDGFVTQDELGDDVTKIHFHFGVEGLTGAHILNVYKLPRQDDKDLLIKPFDGVLRGSWDDSDENLDGIPSFKLSDALLFLCNSNAYVNVHTATDETGAIRGQVVPTSKACKRLFRRGVRP